MKKVLTAVFLFSTTAAGAQTQPNTLNAQDRVALQIGQLVMRYEVQQDSIQALTQQLSQARAELKALRDKYEPKAQPPAKE